jgi:hypothetical protein
MEQFEIEVVTKPLPFEGTATYRTMVTPLRFFCRAVATALEQRRFLDTRDAAVFAARQNIGSGLMLREFTRVLGMRRPMETDVALALGDVTESVPSIEDFKKIVFKKRDRSERAEGQSRWERGHRSTLPSCDDQSGQARIAGVHCIRDTGSGVWHSSDRAAWDAKIDLRAACERAGLTEEETAVACARNRGFKWRVMAEHLTTQTGELWDQRRVSRVQRSLSRMGALLTQAAIRETVQESSTRVLSDASRTVYQERLYTGGSVWVHNDCRELEFKTRRKKITFKKRNRLELATRLLPNSVKHDVSEGDKRYLKAA